MHPRADAGLHLVEPMPASVHLIFGGMVIVRRVHVSDERDVVRAGRKVRPPIGDLDAALTVFLKPHLQWIDDWIRVANVDFGGDYGSRPFIVERRLEWIGEGSLIKGFAGMSIERRFGIKRF